MLAKTLSYRTNQKRPLKAEAQGQVTSARMSYSNVVFAWSDNQLQVALASREGE